MSGEARGSPWPAPPSWAPRLALARGSNASCGESARKKIATGGRMKSAQVATAVRAITVTRRVGKLPDGFRKRLRRR